MSGGMEDTAKLFGDRVRNNRIPVENNIVNHPKHYTSHPSGIECIEITRHMTFNCGNVVKYIWRAGEKGNPVTDLEKARWYIDDEIKRLKETQVDCTREDSNTEIRGRGTEHSSDNDGA